MSGSNIARLVVLLASSGQCWSVCGDRDGLHEQYEELKDAVRGCVGGYHEVIGQQDCARRSAERMLVKIEDVSAISFQEP